MTLRTTSLALATAIVALGVTSLADGASAQYRINPRTGIAISEGPAYPPHLSRAPQPNLPAATSRPSSRDMRGAPSVGGGMRRGMGGARMNGGMGRR